jgi:hypothetical protein
MKAVTVRFFICAQNLWSNCLLQQTVLFESGVVYILILNIINFTYSLFLSIHFVVIAISEHSRSELMKNGVSKTLRKGSFTLQKSRNDSSPLFFVSCFIFYSACKANRLISLLVVKKRKKNKPIESWNNKSSLGNICVNSPLSQLWAFKLFRIEKIATGLTKISSFLFLQNQNVLILSSKFSNN